MEHGLPPARSHIGNARERFAEAAAGSEKPFRRLCRNGSISERRYRFGESVRGEGISRSAQILRARKSFTSL